MVPRSAIRDANERVRSAAILPVGVRGLVSAIGRVDVHRTFLKAKPRCAYLAGALLLMLALPRPAVSQDLAQPPNQAKNLARSNCGTHLTVLSKTGEPIGSKSGRALLLDDNTLSYRLVFGQNVFFLTLPTISNLDRFTFINEKCAATGTVQLYVSSHRSSPNGSSWVPVGRPVQFGKQRFTNVPLAAIEGKYVKVVFKVEHAGTIAGVGLYGQRTLTAFADQHHVAYNSLEPKSQNGLEFNLANLYARARVVSVSSGKKELANRMIDDDPTTGYEFAPDDPHPTVAIELATDQRLRRVSAVYHTQSGRLDIYLLNQLPDPHSVDQLKPIVSLADDSASGKAAADFDPRGARYVVLKWTRSVRMQRPGTFNIAEVGVFSDVPLGIFNLEAIPEQLAQSTLVGFPPVQPPVIVPASQ
jgi:hypothetical protein